MQYTNSTEKIEYMNVSQYIKIYTYCFRGQAVCKKGSKNGKKGLLDECR